MHIHNLQFSFGAISYFQSIAYKDDIGSSDQIQNFINGAIYRKNMLWATDQRPLDAGTRQLFVTFIWREIIAKSIGKTELENSPFIINEVPVSESDAEYVMVSFSSTIYYPTFTYQIEQGAGNHTGKFQFLWLMYTSQQLPLPLSTVHCDKTIYIQTCTDIHQLRTNQLCVAHVLTPTVTSPSTPWPLSRFHLTPAQTADKSIVNSMQAKYKAEELNICDMIENVHSDDVHAAKP